MPRRNNLGGFAGIAAGNLGVGPDAGFGTNNIRPTLTPYGTLSVPDMHGRPSYFPAIDVPMGQSDPSITFDPRYADNIGLSLNPNNQVDTGRPGFSQFFRYLTDPNYDPGQGGGGPGQNIPPNEDVAPPNNDYYYSSDVYAPGGRGSGSSPRGTPVPDWVDNGGATDSRGNPLRYPIPGQDGSPAGDWASNAKASTPPVVMTRNGPVGRGSFGSSGLLGRGFAGPYGGGNSFGQGVGDFGINPSGNWGAQAWNFGGVSQANLSLGIDPGAMMYRGHLAS